MTKNELVAGIKLCKTFGDAPVLLKKLEILLAVKEEAEELAAERQHFLLFDEQKNNFVISKKK